MSYITKIFKTGAVSKTPGSVIKKMVSATQQKDIKTILEFGAGNGEITEAIITSIPDFNQYDAYEIDNASIDFLSEKFKNINIINKDALQFTDDINQQYDLIICSLPLSFFESEKREQFYSNIKNSLSKNGSVIILFTAFWLKKQMTVCFKNTDIKKVSNIPPYYILTYTNNNA